MIFREFVTTQGAKAWALTPSPGGRALVYIRHLEGDSYRVFMARDLSYGVRVGGFLAAQAIALEMMEDKT